ncbi:MAG: M1 family aminopeptidase [Betaproteobacteria bacterium]
MPPLPHLALALAVVGSTPAAPPDAPPSLRLPPEVRPVRQAVELVVDPAAESFSGTAEIELEVKRPVSVVWLNAAGLRLSSAVLGDPHGMRAARVVAGGSDFVGFVPERPLPAGRARLRASFEGRASRLESEGVFAVRERGDFYLFTQFEPIAARRAFPCFDEPAYKIPWTLTLRVPHGLVALSNTPAVASGREGPRDVTVFAPTRPLPSYLVAFAVGPFDLVDLGRTGRGRTPTRLAVPRGRAADAEWARETTPRILSLLEDYFDRAYPFEKLDQVAIPGVEFAMEHPGLVTYASDLLLPGRPGALESHRAWVGVAAHELAHQWFGNLVTMAWWDDTWLNEAFASWLGAKVTDRFRPEWGAAVERARTRSQALADDSLGGARRVRQPIASKADILGSFDGITYAKGEALLEMVESWLGEDLFRRAVRSYVQGHEWGVATARDFLGALSAVAGDGGPVLSSFLDQTGAPVVRVDVRCDGQPTLLLAQQPYRPLGATAQAGQTWRVPVCVRVSTLPGRTCTVLASPTGSVTLDAPGCPDWTFANAGAAGYYRSAVTPGQGRRVLERGRLSATEKVVLADDLGALVASGDVAAAEALDVVPLLARDADRHVVEAALALLRQVEPLVPDELQPTFAAFVRESFAERAATLGWSGRDGEGDEVRLLRRMLVPAVARLGRDERLTLEAARLAGGWMDGRSVVDPDMIDGVLAAAAASGDRELLERLEGTAVRSADRALRERLLGALGAVRDPVKAGELLRLTLDARLEPRESIRLLLALGSQRETRRAAFDFLRAHYDALRARLPRGLLSPLASLPWIGAGLCSPESRRETAAFFGGQLAGVDGGQRSLAQALEAADQCLAQKRAQQPSVAAFLSAPPEPREGGGR